MKPIRAMKKLVKRMLRYPVGYSFQAAGSVRHQEVTFRFLDKEYVVEADGSTPLYDMIAEIVDYDCYQLGEMDFAKLDPGSVAVDVGGNVGVFSIVLSAVFPGKILCYEPVAENCRFIERNLKRNGVSNVTIIPSALCLQDGHVRFYKTPESVSGTLLPRRDASAFDVPGMSVENLLRAHPVIGLVKLDCEGAEYDLVPEMLSRAKGIQYFTAETHEFPGKSRASLRRMLEEHGYSIHEKPELFERQGFACLFATR